MGVIKWVGYVLLSGFVGIVVYQVVITTIFHLPSFPDVYGKPEAGILGGKFFYIVLGAPIVWLVRQKLLNRNKT